MTDITLSDLERLGALDEAERTFQMDEEAFRAFYDQTARPVWLYLARLTGDRRQADDLLQETYYRFLRTRAAFDSDEHRRHYLFRIATNLVHDSRRRPQAATRTVDARFRIATNLVHDSRRRPQAATRTVDASEAVADSAGGNDASDRLARQIDLARAMERLRPRDRSMLWLAYAQGWSHEEIALTLGLKATSLKSLLHRARRRLATLLVSGAPRTGGTR